MFVLIFFILVRAEERKVSDCRKNEVIKSKNVLGPSERLEFDICFCFDCQIQYVIFSGVDMWKRSPGRELLYLRERDL